MNSMNLSFGYEGDYFRQMAVRNVLVTGASRGIGFACANHLLRGRDQHKVFLVARTEEPLQKLKDEFPERVEFLVGDLTKNKVCETAIQQMMEKFGHIDAVIVSHGVLFPLERLEHAVADGWRKCFNANFFSVLALFRASIQHLRVRNGRFVVVSSGAAEHAYTGWGAYACSKAALNGLVRQMAEEEPVVVAVAITPGRVDTDMQKQIREEGRPGKAMTRDDHKKFKKDFEEGNLLKPEVPAYVLGKLALHAMKELSGECYKWNAEELAAFQDRGHGF